MGNPPFQNRIEQNVSLGSPEPTLWDVLRQHADAQSDTPAILAPGRQSLTFNGLAERVVGIKARLNELGIGRGDRVAVALPNGADTAVCFIAIAACATYVPLNPALNRHELEKHLARVKPRAVLATLHSNVEIRAACESLNIPVLGLSPDVASPAGEFSLSGPAIGVCNDTGWNQPDDCDLIFLTSGTSGQSKLVPWTQRKQLLFIAKSDSWFGVGRGDRALHCTPLYNSHGLHTALMQPIVCGSGIVFLPEFDVGAFYAAIEEFSPTWYSAGFTYQAAIFDGVASYRSIVDQSNFRLIWCGSGRLDPMIADGLEAVFHAPVLERYGMSEASTVCANPLPPSQRKHGTVGIPVADHVDIRQVDGSPCDLGDTGEIVICSEALFDGYLDDPGANADAFRDGWFRTGDVGSFDKDGYLTIVGRVKEIINRGGQKIAPGEIETVLSRHSSVADCICFPIPHATLGHTVAAAVALCEGTTFDEAGLRKHLSDTLTDFKIPDRIVVCEEVPRGPTGKPLRQKAADLLGLTTDQMLLAETKIAPPTTDNRSPLVKSLAGLWSDVLRVDDVPDDENFILLGGDSLRAARLFSAIEEVFGVTLPAEIIYREGATLLGMATAITDARNADQGRSSENASPSDIIRPRNPGVACPLTFSQQRIWMVCKSSSNDHLYNLPGSIRVTGKIEPEVMRRVINAIVERHEALRATFPVIDGEPRQVFLPALTLDMPVIDLRDFPRDERDSALARHVSEQGKKPFDLENGPLIRCQLVQLSDTDSVLILPRHHIISDGSSNHILYQEIVEFYRAFSDGTQPALKPLNIQFGDFALWQRERLSGDRLNDLLRYWRSHLEGAPVVISLPTDRPRPQVQSYRGARIQFEIPKAEIESIRAVGADRGASLYNTMLAIFDVLLYRLTGQQNFIVGTAMDGRVSRQAEALMGFFVNTLPLHCQIDGDTSFPEHLTRVCDAMAQAREHADMPFDRIVEELNPPRDTGCAPLVQTVFTFQPKESQRVELPGLCFEPISSDQNVARFDLSFIMSEEKTGLGGFIEYSSDLFDEETILRFVEIFRVLLTEIADDPERKVSAYPLLSAKAYDTIVKSWAGSNTPYPSEATVPQLFSETVSQYPGAVAVVSGDRHVTYRTLDDWSSALAVRLRPHCTKTESVIAISAERSPLLIAGLLAILKAGGTYLALDPSLPMERIRFMLKDANASVCLVQEGSSLPTAQLGVEVMRLDGDQSGVAGTFDDPVDCEIRSDNLAYITYTSGSTGQPKGVCIPHRGVARLVKDTDYAHFGPDEVFLQVAPVAFDASTFEIWGCLLNGGTLVQAPADMPSLSELARIIESNKISTVWLTSGLFHQMVDHELDCFRQVRQVLTGGDVVSVDHVTRFIEGVPDCRLISCYGPTENTTFTTAFTVRDSESVQPSVPIGWPIANTQIYVLDEWLNPVPIGIEGELYIGGDGLARGYLNRPDLTAERFISDPFGAVADARLYRTGDRVRFLSDGSLQFVGRVDNQVKIRGYRIEPDEVSAVLSQHVDLRQAAVVATTSDSGEKSLCAYFVPLDATHSPETAEIKRFLSEQLPPFMIPSRFVSLDRLPLTPNGKLDRDRLPEFDRSEIEVCREVVAPRTPIEELLGEIWCDLLELDSVDIDANFFDLGGHSLVAMRLIFRLSQELDEELPLQTIFERPTIRALALELMERLLADERYNAEQVGN